MTSYIGSSVNTATCKSYARVADWDHARVHARVQSIMWKLAGCAPNGLGGATGGTGVSGNSECRKLGFREELCWQHSE